jgi:DNA polymerase I
VGGPVVREAERGDSNSKATSAPAVATRANGKQSPSGKKSAHPRIFLIDSFSFIFRAYHAMARQRPMSTKTGVPTSASYVFINMLRKLRDDFDPEYLAAVFDTAHRTFRDEQAATVTSVRKFDLKTQSFQDIEYKGYKANRSEMPADLAQQVPYIRRALEAYRIPIIEMPGFEADDVIGTLARQASEQSHPVYVVSSDKDMLQLVNEKVCVLNPPKDNLICDRAKVEEILGVPPERVIDVMALRGDSIDNIPGAPGIGDKGSVDLIQRFGSLDNLLEHAAEVEKKTYRESLQQNKDTILWSRDLVTIDTHVPVELNLDSMRSAEPDNEALRALFTELEFTSLIKELVTGVDLTKVDYREAKSAADLDDMLAGVSEKAPLAIALDATIQPATAAQEDELEVVEEAPSTEDSSGGPFKPSFGLSGAGSLFPEEGSAGAPPVAGALPSASFAVGGNSTSLHLALSPAHGQALSAELNSSEISSRLREVLSDAHVQKTIHNLKSAMHVFAERDLQLEGVHHDPMLYSYLLDPTYSSHGLPEVALRRFNLKLSGTLPEAADVTGRLTEALRKEVEETDLTKVYSEIDLPLVPVLFRMEHAGVKIDCDVLAEMSQRLQLQVDEKARDIYDKAGVQFNINSPRQLGDVLFNQLNLPKPVKYGKGKTISTAVDVLENLAAEHEVPRLVLEYRQFSKLKSTYVDALPVLCRKNTGRLHTTFDQTNAATGRLSSRNPNLQNIPIRTELGREIRAAFVAEEGCVLLGADYSQIELRLLAHFSEDELLVEAFRRGDDIHTLTASQVFGVPPLMINAEHRRRAKAVNFGIVYGLSAFGLSQQIGIEPREAKQFIDAYFEKYSGVRRFIDSTLEQARRDGKVFTLFGRVRPIPDINGKNANLRGFAERTAVNTPLQGTAADLIKLAMIRIDRELQSRRLKSRMTLQVHDELVFEVPEDEVDTMRQLVKQEMENVHTLRVPLLVEVGVGKNWRDME